VTALSKPTAVAICSTDSRGEAAWRQGHLPGAVHLPTNDIARLAGERIPADATVVGR
jgi:rhodanese-related sulfurtransferase